MWISQQIRYATWPLLYYLCGMTIRIQYSTHVRLLSVDAASFLLLPSITKAVNEGWCGSLAVSNLFRPLITIILHAQATSWSTAPCWRPSRRLWRNCARFSASGGRLPVAPERPLRHPRLRTLLTGIIRRPPRPLGLAQDKQSWLARESWCPESPQGQPGSSNCGIKGAGAEESLLPKRPQTRAAKAVKTLNAVKKLFLWPYSITTGPSLSLLTKMVASRWKSPLKARIKCLMY